MNKETNNGIKAPKVTRFKVGELWGIGDSEGYVVLEPEFRRIERADDDLFWAYSEDGMWLVRSDGTVVVKTNYFNGGEFLDGIAIVTKLNEFPEHGYIRKDGTLLFEPQFFMARPFKNGLARVGKRTKGEGCRFGYAKADGTMLTPLKYTKANDFDENGYAPVQVDGETKLLTSDGREHNVWYMKTREGETSKSNQSESSKLIPIRVDNKWGYIDDKFHVVILPQFDQVQRAFVDGLAKVRIGDKMGLIRPDGSWALGPLPFKIGKKQKSSHPTFGSDTYRLIWDNYTIVGIVYADGSLFMGRTFDEISQKDDVSKPEYNIPADVNDLLWILVDGKWGLASLDGTWVVEPRFEKQHSFVERHAAVKLDGKWGFINEDGSWLIEPQFDYADYFTPVTEIGGACAAVMSGDKWGYIKEDGTWLIAPKYDEAYKFYPGGFAGVGADGEYGYINTKGDWIWEPTTDEEMWRPDFYEHYAIVGVGGKLGVLEEDGTWRIEPSYDRIGEFENGFSEIMLDDKAGFIREDGSVLVAPKYDPIPAGGNAVDFLTSIMWSNFANGFARVSIDDKVLYVDTEGREYTRLPPDAASPFYPRSEEIKLI